MNWNILGRNVTDPVFLCREEAMQSGVLEQKVTRQFSVYYECFALFSCWFDNIIRAFFLKSLFLPNMALFPQTEDMTKWWNVL